jgi:hypothetical protein
MLPRVKKASIGLGIVFGFFCLAGFLAPGGPSLRLAAAAALCPLILVPFVIPRRAPRGENRPAPAQKEQTEPASTTPHTMGGNYA